jgi:hypothetical protein
VINVLQGSHTIGATVMAGTFGVSSVSPVFNVATGASLNLTSAMITFNAGPANGVTKQGGGTLIMRPFTFGNLRIDGGTLAITPGSTSGGQFFKPYSLNIAAGAALDLTNNSFVSGAGDNDINNIRGQIGLAYAGGSWTGTSTTSAEITSSTAAAVAADSANTHKTGVAYAVASSLTSAWIGGPNPGGNNILLSYTLLGDADINGSVDSNDFTALAQNFGSSSQYWVNGDFNYDGVVNALDFNALASNYGAPLASGALGALVPEPTAAMAGCVLALLCRRNRTRQLRRL